MSRVDMSEPHPRRSEARRFMHRRLKSAVPPRPSLRNPVQVAFFTLIWMARGKTNKEIGLILDISPRTTAKHLEHIYAKFGLR